MKQAVKITISFLFLLLFGRSALPQPVAAQEPVPVLAFYYAWFDQNTWTSGQSVDLPAEYYSSADRATIERHVVQAQSAGIDALIQSWLGPQEENNQTETNFRMLLDVAQGQGFRVGVDFEVTSPFFADAGAVTNALTSLLSTHAQHSAYLRYQDKPVIFFWRQQRFSIDEWLAIRSQVDPDRNAYWIAEGVDISYQAVFDGHHLYSIAWADSPAGQMAKWGNNVRAYESENQVDRLWVATAMPGYDDTRLPRDDAFAVDRRNGDYYRETWQGAVSSQPDMVIITSFNEWLEGTHIEPSTGYGNLYLDVTRELVTGYRGQAPVAPLPAAPVSQDAQEAPAQEPEEQEDPPPAEPYIRTENLTNVRSGADTTFEIVGRLAISSTASVVGRLESNEWWQIDYEAGLEGKGWVAAEVVEFVGDISTVAVVASPSSPPVQATGTPDAASDSADRSSETPEPVEVTPSVQVSSGGVNVRTGPGLDFELLGRLDEGVTAPVISKNETGEWWQISYEAGEGGLAWVADIVVTFSGDAASVPVAAVIEADVASDPETPSLAPAEQATVGTVEANEPINVRAEPAADSERLGGLFPGETADVRAISEDGAWWQIDYIAAPDQPAWVAAEFVTFSGDELQVPVFGLGTVTPTPGPTSTPTSTPFPNPTPPVPLEQPTFAPTATSVYQATSAALMDDRGTPEPSLIDSDESSIPFSWRSLPWGILSVLVIIGFFWYQLARRVRRR